MRNRRIGAEDPTVAQRWDVARLEEHARTLAQQSTVATQGRRVNLHAHLRGNARFLQSAYRAIVLALRDGRAITPAAEWLVDNFHVVLDEISDLSRQVSSRSWQALPALDTSDLAQARWPRVLLLTREYLAHTDYGFDADSFASFVLSYQTVAPLSMRELWALGPVVRLALLDEMRRLAIRMEGALHARSAADQIANSLLQNTATRERSSIRAPFDRAHIYQQPFVVQLAHRLQSMGAERQPTLDQLIAHLQAQGLTIDIVTQREHARRSSSNLTARNIITSLRGLSSFDWRTLFECTSLVELRLRDNPSYVQCDRRTRDRYRHCVEDLADRTGREETEIAGAVLNALSDQDDIGEWLLGSKRLVLEKLLAYPPRVTQRLRRLIASNARLVYLGALALTSVMVTLLTLAAGLEIVDWRQATPWVFAALAMWPASELALAVINRSVAWAFPPRSLPRLALTQGITKDLKTLVVMPILLRRTGDAEHFAHLLHVHALANPDPELRFALLSDWADSADRYSAADGDILDEAMRAIAALNVADRQPPGDEPRFYLFHRPRLWNECENTFMGWERKRGKLTELNQLLLGNGSQSFIAAPGATLKFPKAVKYVLTLDADTRLPLGVVRDLVAVAAHPLHTPVLDRSQKRIVRGYGILQPRVTPLLPTHDERSLYREMTTAGSGLDPYAAAVSDTYQDLFGEGVFSGKGLYDLAAFEAALDQRVPDNSLLSHDLFEGLFARCALVSQVEVYEDFPSHSEVAAARTHRWLRGDWQLLPWILGVRGRLPPLGRWKMIDNLRRALLAPAAVALLVMSLCVPQALLLPWLALILAPCLLPAFVRALLGFLFLRPSVSIANQVRQVGATLLEEMGRAAVTLGMLAHNAWLSLDAAARAVYRMTVSRRRLLQWVTAAQVKESSRRTLRSFVWSMQSACIVVLIASTCIFWLNPAAMLQAVPLLLAWWLAPVLAHFLSKPYASHPRSPSMPTHTRVALRQTARQTWHFFETFVTAEDNHLPPDNFQHDPSPVVAHRSSPTNIGLYLLATVAARDFGWLGLVDLSNRLAQTLASLERLTRYKGHFFNWYDTRSLAPLEPRYVSTVDSGNLAGHLIALKQALREIERAPLFAGDFADGLNDTVALLTNSVDTTGVTELQTELLMIQQILAVTPESLHDRAQQLRTLRDSASAFQDLALEAPVSPDSGRRLLLHYAQLLQTDISSQLRDLELLLPAGAALSQTVNLQQLIAVLTAERQCALSAPRIPQSLEQALNLAQQLQQLGAQCQRLIDAMQFDFLYDRQRGLFTIGYRVNENSNDPGFYDLLGSEARLASLVAIAKGDAPRSHWLRLGRHLTGGSRRAVLASWSGSMFEYLMPALVMREPRFSLLDQTNRRVVTHQIEFGARKGLPWGMSESAYNVRDREYTYQYAAFGLPSLGLKRGLGDDLVVAPYATALAAMYAPEESQRNFDALVDWRVRGEYGFYEAIDFTTHRLPEGAQAVVIRAYMAHHQGMSLVALDNALHDNVMQTRFHADPMIEATELLLQERPTRFADAPLAIETTAPLEIAHDELPELERRVAGISTAAPLTHLLSNRQYAVMLTDSGAGYSRGLGRAVTRWREDATQDHWGFFIYLRDVAAHHYWSAGFQPTAVIPDDYAVLFKEERVTFHRRDGTLTTRMDVIVAAEDHGELRRVSLSNTGTRTRTVELTSYSEVCLATQAADLAHPAFSNLFVRTEFDPQSFSLLAHRRARAANDASLWSIHSVNTSHGAPNHLEYETDRLHFIGRGRDVRAPQAIADGLPLTNTVGGVLDPILSLRVRLDVPPGATVTATFALFVADSRAQAMALANKYSHLAIFEQLTDFAWTFVRAELHHLQSTLLEARLFQTLASHLLYGGRALRAAADTIAVSQLDHTHLWRFAISGDRPLLLLLCRSNEALPFLRQCLRAQEYLRVKTLLIDIAIINEERYSYLDDLQQAIDRLVEAHTAMAPQVGGEERGKTITLRADRLTGEERHLLLATARVVLQPEQGSLAEQLKWPDTTTFPVSLAAPHLQISRPVTPDASGGQDRGGREYYNGTGGFAADGREYLMTLTGNHNTPAPWVNVMANPQFGTVVSERGAMCTWSLNSRENQLTPWSNDAVTDPCGEAFYIHDIATATVWCPTPAPIRITGARYDVAHGQGYSRFTLNHSGISSELRVMVPPEDPIKICSLTLHNTGTQSRRLRIVSYVQWVLGFTGAVAPPNVVTQIDPITKAMFAKNSAHPDFGTRVAFADLGGRQQMFTASRREFLGRSGLPSSPAGLRDVNSWSARAGASSEPCCAFAVTIELAPGSSEEIVFLLGQAQDSQSARELIQRYRRKPVATSVQEIATHWNSLLGAVQIRTPDRALDLLFNRWLLYQTVSCRLWGRSGFYQAGGAYGFRDQLQDGMALAVSHPALTRAHLLRAAARQFVEGDVQHWWHPQTGRGVRTHFSDDRVWLPFAISQYLLVTEDQIVLDEKVPFLEGALLAHDQEDAHYVPEISALSASLYEHGARALDVSLRIGAHGLPLMGGGDWNDGMNRVGQAGRGESVWLAWFLIANLRQWAPLAEQRGDLDRAHRWSAHADALAKACEVHGWDGAWYRRAFFDDGSPLGSAANAECRIDSLAQSWAVLSRAGDPQRAARAMESVQHYLVRDGDGLVLLLTPPFETSTPDPGYIKAYLPGLRENGGQYTHAAIWVLMAEAALGRSAQVGALLEMLNPIRRAATPGSAHAYGVEPYVVAADIYSSSSHARRGGWSWYTGAAGWYYQAVLESVLGVRIRGNWLSVKPCLPPAWHEFSVTLTGDGMNYRVEVVRCTDPADAGMTLDDVAVKTDQAPIWRDQQPHVVRVRVC